MVVGTNVMPGDEVSLDSPSLSLNPSQSLTLGPGLQHVPPSTILAVVAGEIRVEPKKNTLWVAHEGGRYRPSTGDLVIATVHHSSTEFYHCAITPHTQFATLPQLAFENATKKTRPLLGPGALVYARVSFASKHVDPELDCTKPSSGKADGLGPLKGGMLFEISLGMARRLMSAKSTANLVVLEEIAQKIPFEIAVGQNGRLWVDSDNLRATAAVGSAVQQVDEKKLGIEEQRRLVKSLLKEIS